jgi:DNA repair exonuclease SbcCD nuclease subunit
MVGVTWLHLSDWHQNGMQFDRRVVRDALKEDIENRSALSEKLSTVDFVVFSGDLSYRGKSEEFQKA